MIQTGVTSTGSRRNARRKRLLRWVPSTMWIVESLRDHHLEAAFDLRVARVLERGQRIVAVEIHLALQGRSAALDAGFAVQRPAAEQVLLQGDAAVARRAAGRGRGLQVEVHAKTRCNGEDIVARDQG